MKDYLKTTRLLSNLCFFNRLFSASIACSPSYQTTDDVKCDFHLTNIGDRAYSVLTWNTPLNKMEPSGLAVTRDEKKLDYDGIVMKREAPGRREFKALMQEKPSRPKLIFLLDTTRPSLDLTQSQWTLI